MTLCNDDLRGFVQARGTPYDPVEACPAPVFPGSIRTTRHSAIYAMHSYHQGKKPHDAIRQYVRHFSQPGELVLDPFCGSGGTALAAMLEGRTAIALDRSPAAVFIARNYCTPFDPERVQQAAGEVLAGRGGNSIGFTRPAATAAMVRHVRSIRSIASNSIVGIAGR